MSIGKPDGLAATGLLECSTMDHGIAVFTGYPMTPAQLGREVEQRGFESLFYAEHTHIPVRSRRGDGSPAVGYARTYDPFVALAAAASVTETLLLGTGVCLVTEREPITTAKAVASVDHLSGGRIRRCWSAATGLVPRSGCFATATAGCRSAGHWPPWTSWRPASPRSGGVLPTKAAGPSRSRFSAFLTGATWWTSLPRPGWTGACSR